MTDGWDLYAVVRSCTSTAATATPSVGDNHHMVMEDDEDPNPDFGSVLNTPLFSYPPDDQITIANHSRVQGLEEIYNQFSIGTQPQQIHQPQHQALLAPQAIITNSQTSTTTRSRRRKNQQMKMVHQMTQEELYGDSWAWRKYGQKPIKGSPYPRNYYRCSTSKGCAARRQVERSPIDGTILIVSYTGDHTHPRPTHRSSLAGSTRNKLSTVSKPASCSSSSAASASSFSPPLMEGESHEAQHDNNVKLVELEVDDDNADEEEPEEEEEEDILIPNSVRNEDVFKGFHELNGGTGFFD